MISDVMHTHIVYHVRTTLYTRALNNRIHVIDVRLGGNRFIYRLAARYMVCANCAVKATVAKVGGF